jgi:HK97 gp10 family phage protein
MVWVTFTRDFDFKPKPSVTIGYRAGMTANVTAAKPRREKAVTKIIGLAKLHRKLQRMPAVAKARIQEAMETSANDVVRMAKGLAPVLKSPTPERRAGALRDSIGWTWGKPPRGTITIGKVMNGALGADLTITIYAGDSEAFYARWVEFGTQNMSAQPFFYPSYRASKKSANSRIRRAITRAAREVASS